MRWIEQDLRHLVALAGGGAVAFALFLLMHAFITMHGQTASASPPATPVGWVTVRHDTPVQHRQHRLAKPKPVKQLPPTGVIPQTHPNPVPRQRLQLGPINLGPKGTGPVMDPGPQAAAGGRSLGVLFRIPPQYPPQAVYQNVTGTVTTCFTVRGDGSVANARVVGASSSQARRLLGPAALVSIMQWKFVPRKANGRPVATNDVCQDITFTLNQ